MMTIRLVACQRYRRPAAHVCRRVYPHERVSGKRLPGISKGWL